MITSYLRGHEIYTFDNKTEWRYSHNNKPVDFQNPPPCKHCNVKYDQNEPDPCLGKLPGVEYACCGHGVQKQSYIKFLNGKIIRGFKIDKEKKNV